MTTDKCALRNCEDRSEGQIILEAILDLKDAFIYENGMPKSRIGQTMVPVRLPLCSEHLKRLSGVPGEVPTVPPAASGESISPDTPVDASDTGDGHTEEGQAAT